jgi:hypothetical protein
MSTGIEVGTMVLTKHEANGLMEFLMDYAARLHRMQGLSQITEAEAALFKHDEDLATTLVKRLETINFGE